MYYDRILRIWVIDAVDYFLLSALVGSIVASRLKDYLSEKKSIERLKNSIIKKSKLVINSDRAISNSKEIRIKKIQRFALENRGGQFENVLADHEFSNEVFKFAQDIRRLVEQLAKFLKERELKGVAKIFFKNGRLLLELILYKCKIEITYAVLTEGLSTQVIVISSTAGGAAGFTWAWFTVGATLAAPTAIVSTVLLRSVAQQIFKQRDYLKFKELINQMLEDDELKQTVRAFFMEEERPITTGIEMKPWDSNKNRLPEFHFNSDQTWEELIKAKMKTELGLVENPTSEQIEKLIQTRKMKPKGKTVYFKDFIDKIANDPDDIIDAEIVKETIKVKVKNEEL